MSNLAETTLPALPIKNSVFFPYLLMPISVGRPASLAAVEAALASEDKTIAIFTQRSALVEEPKPDELYPIGTAGIIKKMARSDDGMSILVQGFERIQRIGVVLEQPYLNVRVRLLREPEDTGTEVEALQRAVSDLANRMIALVQPQVQASLNQIFSEIKKPLHQVYLLGSLLSLDLEKEVALLSASTQRDALQLIHGYLTHEVQVLELRNQIASQAQTEITRQQREHMLRQQLRAIQSELGEQSPEQADVVELRKRLEEARLPELVAREVNKELSRLERMSSSAPDYQITRAYIELILELPWDKTTEDSLDLVHAREILDEDHFDLEEVKDRIIEHLAVMKLNPQAKGPILCFVGPPGVGKTSVGQSIARALGRRFERMSLGGLHDEAELRGHRRTYVGALPGRIVRAIRQAGVRNPLLMLDEVDKLGQDFRGDPAAALMEILDPAQNAAFRDNYLDLPFDLSQVFFITTANSLDTIPKPLLDRMEVLRLAGYSDEEKLAIAKRYLIARRLSEAGVATEQLTIPEATVAHVIRRYTREAGVREVERLIGQIARKTATRIAQGKTEPLTVTIADLAELLGPERFFAEKARQALAPGVAVGLAWTEAGGDVLYVESALLPEGKDLTLTGQLGEVMQESAKAAKSYVWSHAKSLGISKESIRNSGVHIHVPAGATPKDGPSAGITLLTALTSLYADRPARSDTAMTGEITLSGLVLPVGGVKEKVLAAHRAGIRRIVLPADNRKDLSKLPEHVKSDLHFIFVDHVEDALAAAIPKIAEELESAQATAKAVPPKPAPRRL